jgi:hypothetical protein
MELTAKSTKHKGIAIANGRLEASATPNYGSSMQAACKQLNPRWRVIALTLKQLFEMKS